MPIQIRNSTNMDSASSVNIFNDGELWIMFLGNIIGMIIVSCEYHQDE